MERHIEWRGGAFIYTITFLSVIFRPRRGGLWESGQRCRWEKGKIWHVAHHVHLSDSILISSSLSFFCTHATLPFKFCQAVAHLFIFELLFPTRSCLWNLFYFLLSPALTENKDWFDFFFENEEIYQNATEMLNFNVILRPCQTTKHHLKPFPFLTNLVTFVITLASCSGHPW